MARDWFGRKSDAGITGIDGYYDQPGGWRLWVRRIVGIVVILALLAAFIWAATWVYDSVTGDDVGNGEESGQVTSPGDDSIDNGAPTDGDGTTTDGTDGSSSTGSTSTSNGDTSSSSNPSGTTGSGSAGSTDSNSGSENDSMPRTGDDSGDTPAPATDVLPATGG